MKKSLTRCSSVSSPQSGVDEKSSTKSVTQTKFVGLKSIVTDPVPFPQPFILQEFFELGENRSLLFPKECNVKDLGPITKVQREHLDSISQEMFPPLSPTAQEVQCNILELETPGVNFPGLKVTSISTMTSQLFSCTKGTQEYRFALLSSQSRAEGPKPLLWLFNKLTAADDDQMDRSPKEQTSFSFTRVWTEKTHEGEVVFNTNARLEIRINIPKLIMRLLPVKLEKFEEQGSASIQKLLDRDLGASMERFKTTYLEWMSRYN